MVGLVKLQSMIIHQLFQIFLIKNNKIKEVMLEKTDKIFCKV